MTYEEVRSAIQRTQEELNEIDSDIQAKQKSLDENNRKESSLNDTLSRMIEEERTSVLSKEEEKLSAGYKKEIENISQKIDKLNKKYNEKKSTINFDDYSSYYEKEFEIINSAKDSMLAIESASNDILGERLTKNILNNLSNYKVELSLDDIEELVIKLSKFQKNLKILDKKIDINLSEYLQDFLKHVSPCKDENSEDSNIFQDVVVYTLVCGLISYATITMLSPILVFILTSVGCFNVYRTFLMYRLIIESKSITDNLDEITIMINEDIQKALDDDSNTLEKSFNTNLNKLSKKINEIEQKMSDEVCELRNTFEFDYSHLEKNIETNRLNLQNQNTNLQAIIDKLKIKRSELIKNLSEYENKLLELSGSLIESYLSCDKYGTSFKLDNKFLVDVINNKPKFYELPLEALILLYEDYEECIELLKLVIVQMLNRLNPLAISIEVWDIVKLGIDLQCFAHLPLSIFEISRNKEEVDNSLKNLDSLINKRISFICREFNNILEYNDYMMSISSVPENYVFVFIINTDPKVIQSDEFRRIVTNGSRVGVYVIYLSQFEEFKGDNSTALELLNIMEVLHEFRGDNITPKAKRVYKRLLEK